MAEKTIKTRILLKYDTWENWNSANGQAYVLKAGEMGICAVPVAAPNGKTDKVLFKIGDGKTTFVKLDWASALAADVYDWAKAASKPTYTKDEVGLGNVLNVESYSKTEIDTKLDAVQSSMETDTDTQYQLVLTDHTLKLQSKSKDGSWADVAGQSFTLPDNDTTYTFTSTATSGASFEVTPEGGDAQTVYIDGLGTAAFNATGDFATAAQGKLADSALQKADITTGTTNGTIAVEGADVAVKGLGDAAYKATSYFDNKISAAQTAAEGAQSSADSAKKAADDAQATADAALPTTTFESFKTANTAAIADAKKAGTDAASALEAYKSTNDAAVAQNASDIANLETAVKAGVTFKGKLDEKPAASGYSNGDLIIVEDKEYICYEDSAGTKSWIELGDEGSHLTKTTADGYYVPLERTVAGVDLKDNVTAAELRTALNVADGANNYSHPAGNAASKASGFYKISTDASSHVASVTAVTKADITGLGIPAQDTNQTVKVGTTTFGTNDAVEIVGGTNVTVTPDATSKTITVAGKSDADIKALAENQIQTHTGVDKVGTVTAIKMNGAARTVAADGSVDLGTVITDVSSKQDKLTTDQLAAANSGITAAKVTTYDGYAAKITTLEGKAGLDKVGTVTSVSAGEGLKITGTASVSPKIEIDEDVTFIFDCGGVDDGVDD